MTAFLLLASVVFLFWLACTGIGKDDPPNRGGDPRGDPP